MQINRFNPYFSKHEQEDIYYAKNIPIKRSFKKMTIKGNGSDESPYHLFSSDDESDTEYHGTCTSRNPVFHFSVNDYFNYSSCDDS